MKALELMRAARIAHRLEELLFGEGFDLGRGYGTWLTEEEFYTVLEHLEQAEEALGYSTEEVA